MRRRQNYQTKVLIHLCSITLPVCSVLTVACSQLTFFNYSPHLRLFIWWAWMLFFWWLWPLFLSLRLSRGTIIAANIGQAMVKLKLWLSKSSSLHRKLHGGRGLNSQSLSCESHTFSLGYHAKLFFWLLTCFFQIAGVISSKKIERLNFDVFFEKLLYIKFTV